MKLRDLVEQRDNLKYKLEVYKQLFIFLQEFIATDSRDIKKFISIEGSEGQFVPDYVIEEVITNIEQEFIKKLEEQVLEMNERKI